MSNEMSGNPRDSWAAWNRGYTAGKSVTMRRMSDEPATPDAVNPYAPEFRDIPIDPTDVLMAMAAERDLQLIEDWDPSRPDEAPLPRPQEGRQ